MAFKLNLLLLSILFFCALYKALTHQFEEGWTWVDKVGLTFLGYVIKIWFPIILIASNLEAKSDKAPSDFGQEQKINYAQIFVSQKIISARPSPAFIEVLFLKYKGETYECNCVSVICDYPLSDKKRSFLLSEASVRFEKENSRFKFMTHDRCQLENLVFSKPSDLKELVDYYEQRYATKIHNKYHVDLENGTLAVK